ncbi:MAG: FAD:protein FMN transferase [Pseudomonadota bacterium]
MKRPLCFRCVMGLISLIFVGLLASCGSQPVTLSLTGETWGTTYNIVIVDRSDTLDPGDVEAAIEAVLVDVDSALSNWNPSSEVSQFNATDTTEPVAISEHLADVISTANRVHDQSLGRFDLTLGPLIDLWGFGTRKPDTPLPSDEAIQTALTKVGQLDVLTFNESARTLQKTDPEVNIYLAALAKGYGIDQIAQSLSAIGATDYLVEVGGDLTTAGLNPEGDAWRIGIEVPDSAPGAVQEIVELTGLAMATSGDYRNYYEVEGVRYSHIIDGKTGRPITHTTASVTVIAETATLADAWATALLVLGEEAGLDVANRLDLAAYFIVRDTKSSDTVFRTVTSRRFEELQNGG